MHGRLGAEEGGGAAMMAVGEDRLYEHHQTRQLQQRLPSQRQVGDLLVVAHVEEDYYHGGRSHLKRPRRGQLC
jgi:hypothetical protein